MVHAILRNGSSDLPLRVTKRNSTAKRRECKTCRRRKFTCAPKQTYPQPFKFSCAGNRKRCARYRPMNNNTPTPLCFLQMFILNGLKPRAGTLLYVLISKELEMRCFPRRPRGLLQGLTVGRMGGRGLPALKGSGRIAQGEGGRSLGEGIAKRCITNSQERQCRMAVGMECVVAI